MSYRVQFLDDQEFDQLPATEIHSSIGVAYPETGEAFVRKSGMPAIDAFTALHELEHLQGNDLDEHYDAESGCYYKKPRDWIRPIAIGAAAMFAPQLLGGLGAMMGGGGAASAAGYAANAGRIGAGMGLGIGSGTAAGSAAASSAAGIGASSALSQFGKSTVRRAMGQVGGDLASSLFGGGYPQGLQSFNMPEFSSSQPAVQQVGPNVVPGASGTGSQGGAGGAPGSIGGGMVSKIKQYLSQRDQTDQYSGGVGGGNY